MLYLIFKAVEMYFELFGLFLLSIFVVFLFSLGLLMTTYFKANWYTHYKTNHRGE